MGGVRARGPLSLSAVEPEPDCNGVDNVIVFALVFVLACVGFKKLRGSQKPRAIEEPLMEA